MSDSIKLRLKNNLRSSNKKLLKQDITNNFPQLWNKLPITVTNENNTNTFKSKLHKYLFGLDWYNLTHPYNIPTATELSNWFTLYFNLIQYLLLKNQYSTTLFSTAYITFPLLLLTSYQPHYHTLPPLHVHWYLTYFLYILSPIQFSNMYNVHCTLPSHAIPSHVTSLHILPQLLPRFYLFWKTYLLY